MTRTKEQIRKAVFGKLKCLRRRLQAAGVPCSYSRSILFHENGGTGFAVRFHADSKNGDSILLPRISIRSAEGTESFDELTLDQGLARIRELFQVHDDASQNQSGCGNEEEPSLFQESP